MGCVAAGQHGSVDLQSPWGGQLPAPLLSPAGSSAPFEPVSQHREVTCLLYTYLLQFLDQPTCLGALAIPIPLIWQVCPGHGAARP